MTGTSADLVLLEGFHPLKHALRFGAHVDEVLVADRERVRNLAAELAPDLLDRIDTLPYRHVDDAELARHAGGRSHGRPEVIALARRTRGDVGALLEAAAAPIVLLEEPTHLGNIGAVVRVAAAAGAAAVLTTGPLDPWHTAALRGSAGLHFALAVEQLSNVGSALASGRIVVAADPEGTDRPGPLPERALVVLGSERRGLTSAVLTRAHQRVRIPMREGVSSLNLATAAAVLLYAGR